MKAAPEAVRSSAAAATILCMGEDLRLLDEALGDTTGLTGPELERVRGERLLGAAAIMLHQQGKADAARLAADVTTLSMVIWSSDFGHDEYRVFLDVEPHLLPMFEENAIEPLAHALQAFVAREPATSIESVVVRPLVPRVSKNWREQLRTAEGPGLSNQARRIRLEESHPFEDGLHFTNEWEHRVYKVLKQRQAALPSHETLGIIPLPGMRVAEHTFEPDFLVTYQGRAGVIEVDGPHHTGRAANDRSRERLLMAAGVRYVDRLDVRDTTTPAEVQSFVDNFLRRMLAA